MDERIGFGIYKSCENRGIVGRMHTKIESSTRRLKNLFIELIVLNIFV